VDVQRFITENFELLSQHCLETYHSALVWLPEQSQIYSKYAGQKDSPWKILCGRSKTWGSCETVLEGHLDGVTDVTFSFDSSHIVSASHDTTVHIWNVVTGNCEAELKGHSHRVTSVVFSPDGSHIVSASFDNTVRIWNAVTGNCEAELKGHSDHVTSVVFDCRLVKQDV
jgi:WD40 repeat protein